jgi:hypothetical protein
MGTYGYFSSGYLPLRIFSLITSLKTVDGEIVEVIMTYECYGK